MSLESTLKTAFLKNAEIFAKSTLEEVYGPSVAELEKKLKDLIPGEQYDVLATMILQTVTPTLKSIMMAQIEKIHQPEVAAV
jgi:hypothetical protein